MPRKKTAPLRVFAENAARITCRHDFNGKSNLRIPSLAELIQSTREALDRRDAYDARRGNTLRLRTVFPELESLHTRRARFDRMLKMVGEGYKVVPVFHARVWHMDCRQVREETQATHETGLFRQMVAQRYYDEAQESLKLDDHAMACMMRGRVPENRYGQKLAVSVDHRIELYGGGQWVLSQSRAVDMLDPMHRRKRKIDHYGNKELTTDILHVFKNEFMNLVTPRTLPPGTVKPILTILQEKSRACSGFISRPQPKGHPLAGITLSEHFSMRNVVIVPVSARYGDSFVSAPAVHGRAQEYKP